MRPLPLLLTVLSVFIVIAEPAMAQSIDLSPIQNLLQGIVDALTGPLGVVIATLAVIGVFLSWFFNIIDPGNQPKRLRASTVHSRLRPVWPVCYPRHSGHGQRSAIHPRWSADE